MRVGHSCDYAVDGLRGLHRRTRPIGWLNSVPCSRGVAWAVHLISCLPIGGWSGRLSCRHAASPRPIRLGNGSWLLSRGADAELQNPPRGSFIAIHGIRLHYSNRGNGRPGVLIHGSFVTGDDYNTSGVPERGTGRVILFDVPGPGYSERPRWRPWGQ